MTGSLFKMESKCNFQNDHFENEEIIKYCASKKEITDILNKLEDEIYCANSQYDKLVNELIDLYVSTELSEKEHRYQNTLKKNLLIL